MNRLKFARENNLLDEIGLSFNLALIDLLIYLNDELEGLGVKGNVAEIGVAGGAFFIPLALCCGDDEVAVAIDVFEDIDLNWNIEGGTSSKQKIIEVSQRAKLGDSVRFVSGDSLHIDKTEIMSAGEYRRVKLFSIDGSHSVHHTVGDLELAEQVIAPGGIVFLDDVQNWGWPGAIEGFARYSLLQPQPRLVPFLLFGNKFLLTTACHQERLSRIGFAYSQLPGKLEAWQTARVSRFFGWDVTGW